MLSIIIPVFNEEQNIVPVVQKIIKAITILNRKFEVIFINDGSTDATAEELAKAALKGPHIKVIHLRKNFGQTAAMMAGIDYASGDIIIPMDGDLQNDPDDISRLISKLDEGYDVVSGWRKDRKDNPLKRNLPSKLANFMISFISGVRLKDYGCSLKVYRKDVIKGVKLYGEMHRFIPIYASWLGAKVTELPVIHHQRKFGVSKYGFNRTIKVILDLIVVKFLAKYQQKPIYIFGGVGFFFVSISFVCFCVMLILKYTHNISFIQTPLPLLIVIFLGTGMQSILMGLIAEILNRTYHESQGKPTYLIKSTANFN